MGCPLRQLYMTGGLAREGTYHGLRVGVGSGLRVPLHHNLSGRTGVGTVIAGQTGLIRAHGPTRILGIGGDRNQANISRELTLSTFLLQSNILGASLMLVMKVGVAVAVAMASGINARDQGDEGGSPGRSELESHCGRGISKE